MLTAIKGEIDSNTTIVGDFNTPLSPMDRSSKMKINKETHVWNDTLNKMDLIDIYRTFHPKTRQYTFFSSAHGTFSRIDHILSHTSSLGKFKKMGKFINIWKLNSTLEQILGQRKHQKRILKIPLDKQKWKHNISKPMGLSKSSIKWEVYSNKDLHYKRRKILNDLTLHLKELEKEQTKPKVSRRKG